MRLVVGLTLAFGSILLLGADSFGQPAGKETLDTVLHGWEKAMTDLQSFACVVQRKTLDKALGGDS